MWSWNAGKTPTSKLPGIPTPHYWTLHIKFLLVDLSHFLMGAPEWVPQTKGAGTDLRFMSSTGHLSLRTPTCQNREQAEPFGSGRREVLMNDTPLIRANFSLWRSIRIKPTIEKTRAGISAADEPSHVLEEHKKVHWVGRRGDEIEFQVEAPGLLILRMYSKGTYAGNIGRLQRSQHRILY